MKAEHLMIVGTSLGVLLLIGGAFFAVLPVDDFRAARALTSIQKDDAAPTREAVET